MAVSTVQPLPKSQPDVTKLNTFNGYMVTVTRHLQPRGTVGTTVIPTMKMTKDQLLELQVSLPMKYGAGFYHFTVADEGGTGDDTWMVKLGSGDVPQQEASMAGPMNGVPPTAFPATPAPAAPLDSGVTQILPGWYYNAQMGLLTTPWRETVTWNPTDPLPKAPAHAQQTQQHASTPWPNANQWGNGAPWPNANQWGGYPVQQSEDSTKVRQLEAQIAEDRRTRELDAVRQQTDRQMSEMRAMIAESNARFEKLIEKVMTKPAGDSPEVIALRQQTEVMQRRLDDEKREREAERREAATREEVRRNREDMERMIRELQANKSDPMIPMIMQMMTSQNANAMEAVKAIQAATTTAGSAAERQTNALVEQLRSTVIKPTEIMAMMQGAKGDSAEMARMVLETSRSMMDTQRGVFEQLLDVAGQGGQPPWLTAVQSAMDKIGPIGEAIAARSRQQPQVVVQRVPVPVDPTTGQPIRVAPRQAPGPQAQQLNGTPPAANAEATAAAAEPAKRGRKPKLRSVPAGPEAAAAPPKAPTTAEIAEMDPDDVALMIEDFNDVQFFGETLLGYVDTLRGQVKAGVAATSIADTLLSAREHLATLTPRPAAVELYIAGQISVLMERVLPDALFENEKAAEDYCEIIVNKIEQTMEKEAAAAEQAE